MTRFLEERVVIMAADAEKERCGDSCDVEMESLERVATFPGASGATEFGGYGGPHGDADG